jgi:ketosteroid isomerase-like protein
MLSQLTKEKVRSFLSETEQQVLFEAIRQKRFTNSSLVKLRARANRTSPNTLAMTKYKAEDRHIRGRGSFAYVNEREIVEFKDNSGKSHVSDSCWATYVLEKQSDGSWKIVQLHWSGPTTL